MAKAWEEEDGKACEKAVYVWQYERFTRALRKVAAEWNEKHAPSDTGHAERRGQEGQAGAGAGGRTPTPTAGPTATESGAGVGENDPPADSKPMETGTELPQQHGELV